MSTHPQIDMTLGAIAAAWPESMRVFDRFGLDYCCGGGRTLGEACRAAEIDAGAVLEAVARENTPRQEAPERHWQEATMTELADHIERKHHAFVREALGRLEKSLPRVVAAHGARHPELRELHETVTKFGEEMCDHMVREERVLFPWLRRLERPSEITSGPPWSVKRPISCMEHDHEDAGRALERMRALTNGFVAPPDACATYRSVLDTLRDLERDTHRHIHKENNILFPAGVRAEQQLLESRAAGTR